MRTAVRTEIDAARAPVHEIDDGQRVVGLAMAVGRDHRVATIRGDRDLVRRGAGGVFGDALAVGRIERPDGIGRLVAHQQTGLRVRTDGERDEHGGQHQALHAASPPGARSGCSQPASPST